MVNAIHYVIKCDTNTRMCLITFHLKKEQDISLDYAVIDLHVIDNIYVSVIYGKPFKITLYHSNILKLDYHSTMLFHCIMIFLICTNTFHSQCIKRDNSIDLQLNLL